MARPVVGALAEELYAGQLEPYTHADEDNNWPLLTLLGAILDRAQEVADLVQDDEDGNLGWSAIVDPDRAPEEWLPWTAQLVGVVIPPPGSPGFSELDEAGKRLRIKETDGQRRGTPAAIAGAARQFLTGTKTVFLVERHGSAYRLTVSTLVTETPDPDLVEAALLEQKPAGIVLTYGTTTGADYEALRDTHADYAEVAAVFTDYADVLSDPTQQ